MKWKFFFLRNHDHFHLVVFRIKTERREREWEKRSNEHKESEARNQVHKREIKESVERFFKDKEEKAQRYKQERIEKMRQRRAGVKTVDLDQDNTAVESNGKHQVN